MTRRDQNAVGLVRAAADASAQLVQLGEAETFGVLDDHDGGVGNVDADFDDGGGDEDLRFVVPEGLHDSVLFFAGEAAVEQAELELGKDFFGKAFVFFHGGFQFQFRFFDDRIDDVALAAGGDFAAERFPHAGEMRFGGHVGFDGSSARGKFVENGNVKIAVERERKRARDGRGGENENVRRVAVGGGFVHELFALENTETVLLVNCGEAEAGEEDVVFDEGMSADDELRFAIGDAIACGGFFGRFQAADEELNLIAGFFEDAPRGKIVLDSENFGGRHQSGLATVFDGDDRGLQRDDGLAAADVALQQAIHGRGLFEICGDFREDAFLRGGGLERQHALESFANMVFAHAEGDGVFLTLQLAIERHAELIEEKFFEDQALLGGRSKLVEGVERGIGRREVRLDDGVAANRKIHAAADGRGKEIGKTWIKMLQGGVRGAADGARAESADGFVDGNDAADFGRVVIFFPGFLAEQFELRIDHFHARRAEAIDFDFAVQDEQLAGLEAAFEIAAMKKFAGEGETGFVFYEQVVDGVASAHAAYGGTTGYAHAQRVDVAGANIFD